MPPHTAHHRPHNCRRQSPDPVPLTEGPIDYPGTFTKDGKEFVFDHGEAGATSAIYHLYVVSIDQPNKARPLLSSKFTEIFPALSVDGKWLDCCSDESGRIELYVQAYPGLGKRITISIDGATEPVFSRDGKELFYRQGPGMMSVHFKVSGTDFLPEKPALLVIENLPGTTPTRIFDVTADGKFVMIQPIPEQTLSRNAKIFSPTLRVIFNWTK